MVTQRLSVEVILLASAPDSWSEAQGHSVRVRKLVWSHSDPEHLVGQGEGDSVAIKDCAPLCPNLTLHPMLLVRLLLPLRALSDL